MEIKVLQYQTNGAPRTYDFWECDAAAAAATLIQNHTLDHEGIYLLQRNDFISHLQNLIDLAINEMGDCEDYVKNLECNKVLASQQPAACCFLVTPYGAWLYANQELALHSNELAALCDIRGLWIDRAKIYHFAKAKHCKMADYDFEF